MRFLFTTEAPGVETDYGTHAIIDITPELTKLITTRRDLFLQAREQDKGLAQMHFVDGGALFYDGVPAELNLPKGLKRIMEHHGFVQLPDDAPVLGEEVANTPTDLDWMIIDEHGVCWQAALKHICFACFTGVLPYKAFLEEAA